MVNFGEPLKNVMTLRGPFMVSRKLTWTQHRAKMLLKCSKTTCFLDENARLTTTTPSLLHPVCTFKTSPCVPAPRAHVVTHVRVVPGFTRTFWTDTRGLVEWTHGNFSARHTTAHTTTQDTTQHDTPKHTTATRQQQHTETETCRDRERERETEKEDREDKTTEERREPIHFQCGGAWPFFVDGVLFLVNPVCARDVCLLNSVKYDSSLISFSASWQVNSFLISANYLFYAVTVFNYYFLNYLLMQLQFRKISELFSYAVTVFFYRN